MLMCKLLDAGYLHTAVMTALAALLTCTRKWVSFEGLSCVTKTYTMYLTLNA